MKPFAGTDSIIQSGNQHSNNEYSRHLSKLEEIYTSSNLNKRRSELGLDSIKKYKNIKKIHNQYIQYKKETNQCKENEMMWEKLKSISGGNYKSGVPRVQPFYKKSLLADKRRLEDLRRNQENCRMNKRINNMKSVPSIARDNILDHQNNLIEKQHRIHNVDTSLVYNNSRGRLPPILNQRYRDQLTKDANTQEYMNKYIVPGKQLKSSMESDSKISYSRMKEESYATNSCLDPNLKRNRTNFTGFNDSKAYKNNSKSSTLKMYNSECYIDDKNLEDRTPEKNSVTDKSPNHDKNNKKIKPSQSERNTSIQSPNAYDLVGDSTSDKNKRNSAKSSKHNNSYSEQKESKKPTMSKNNSFENSKNSGTSKEKSRDQKRQNQNKNIPEKSAIKEVEEENEQNHLETSKKDTSNNEKNKSPVRNQKEKSNLSKDNSEKNLHLSKSPEKSLSRKSNEKPRPPSKKSSKILEDQQEDSEFGDLS